MKFGSQPVLSGLLLFMAVLLTSGLLSSCGKETDASPTGLNTAINVINASPDIYPVNYFLKGGKKNAKPYIYGTPSGYVYVPSLDTPLQIRNYLNKIIYTHRDTALRPNIRYSIFITGLVADKTDTAIFLTDTSGIPTLGRAKVRFVNASARSAKVDVYANGAAIFKNQGFVAVTPYAEFPAGVYDFKVYAASTSTVLADLPNTTVQDGRLYTLYTRGIVGRTDSAAFTSGIITNK